MTSHKCLHNQSIEELAFQYSRCMNEKNKIVSFFLASLSTKKMIWRSFLPAFVIARTYPIHVFEAGDKTDIWDNPICRICLQSENWGLKEDKYNFYLKQAELGGGINVPTIGFYIVLLSEFNKLKDYYAYPNYEDISIFSHIMLYLTEAKESESLKKDILKKIKSIPGFHSNVFQCQCLLQTLGFCGILETEQHKSPFHEYVNLSFAPKKTHNSDWAYPVDFWTPLDGINKKAFEYWFGGYPPLENYWR